MVDYKLGWSLFLKYLAYFLVFLSREIFSHPACLLSKQNPPLLPLNTDTYHILMIYMKTTGPNFLSFPRS